MVRFASWGISARKAACLGSGRNGIEGFAGAGLDFMGSVNAALICSASASA